MSETQSWFSETNSVMWWLGWRKWATFAIGAVLGIFLIGPFIGLPIIGAVPGLLIGLVLWVIFALHVNRKGEPIVEEFRKVSPDIGRRHLDIANESTGAHSIYHVEGSSAGIEVNHEYVTRTLVVGDSSASIHGGVYLDMKGRGTRIDDTTEEVYYDQVTSVQYEDGALQIATSDGETMSYPSTREPTDALADLQNRVREYKTV